MKTLALIIYYIILLVYNIVINDMLVSVIIVLIIIISFILCYNQIQSNNQIKNLDKPLSTYQKLPKILYLILYNENVDYERQMKQALDRYVNNFNHIKTFFIAFKRLNKEYEINGNVIYFNGSESFIPGILDKTIKALKLLTKIYDYNYVIRSNISTVINLTKITNLLAQNKNTNIYYGGFIIMHICMKCNLKITQFISGTSIILDKISTNFLLNNVDKLRYDHSDDVAIGLLMDLNEGVKKYELPGLALNTTPVLDFVYNLIKFPEYILNLDYYDLIIFYRNKSKDRYNDIKSMNQFIDYLLRK